MEGALKLAATILAQWAVAERSRKAAWQALGVAGTVAVAVLCVAAALGCAVSAIWLGMYGLVGPIWAPLIAGAALLALAAGLYALAYRLTFGARKRRRAAPPAGLASAETARFIAAHKGSLLLAAFVAGLVSSNNAASR